MTLEYSPSRPDPQDTDALRYWVQTELDRLSQIIEQVDLALEGITDLRVRGTVNGTNGVPSNSATPLSDTAGGGGAGDHVNGDFYVCDTAGTYDYGSGNVTLSLNDWLVFAAGNVWTVIPQLTTTVTSFEGRTGVVVSQIGDYTTDEVNWTPTREHISPAQKAQITQNQSDIATHRAALDDHTDVIVTAPQDGDILAYRNGEWLNERLGISAAILYGEAANVSIGTGGNDITNYPGAANTAAEFNVDNVGGTIQVLNTGLYRLTAWVVGQQGNDNKEESMFLDLDLNDNTQRSVIAVFDIATDKTDWRHFSVTATRQLTAGDTLKLRLRGTTGLGSFNIDSTTFELQRLIVRS